jgi:hypothetical protein
VDLTPTGSGAEYDHDGTGPSIAAAFLAGKDQDPRKAKTDE